jgi:ABC-2 type transport system permease protein
VRPESRLARRVVDEALQRAAGRHDAWAPREMPVATPGSRYIDWLVPGLLGMTIMSTSLWGVGFSIVQARTRKLLRRLVATPMRRRDYLLAQAFARLVFLALEAGALLACGRLFFGVPMRGSWIVVIALSVVGALSLAAIGLLVASRAKTIEGLSGLMNLIILPMWIVSGVFFASSNFPAPVQPLIQALPLTALNNALRAVMLEGAPVLAIAREIGVLAAWGVVSFGLALRLFRWR